MTLNTGAAVPQSEGHARGYFLPRGVDEITRLNAQHYALVHRQGWLLHPKIQRSISDVTRPQIADVACGSGVWAFEFADKYPASIVTGLDVSDRQYPPRWTWPDNATLDSLDLAGEVPSEYRAKFDVVHCRYLLMSGPAVDPKVFVDAFSKLLKPGGWLQWEEIPYPPGSAFQPVQNGGAATKDYTEMPVLFDTIAKVASIEYKCAPLNRFEEWMKENSTFQNIEQIVMAPSPQNARLENSAIRGGILGAVSTMSQIDGVDDATKEGLKEDALIFTRREEAGALCAYRYVICLARAA